MNYYYEHHVKRSRKDYVCECCRNTIEKGSSYTRYTQLGKDGASDVKVHPLCMEFFDKLIKTFDGDPHDCFYSDFYEYLTDIVRELNKRNPSLPRYDKKFTYDEIKLFYSLFMMENL